MIIFDIDTLKSVIESIKNDNTEFELTDLVVERDDTMLKFVTEGNCSLDLLTNLIYSLNGVTIEDGKNVVFWFSLSPLNEQDFLFPLHMFPDEEYTEDVKTMFDLYTHVAIRSAKMNDMDFMTLFETGSIEFDKQIKMNEIDFDAENKFFDEYDIWNHKRQIIHRQS
jgi:hypothetical protein